MLNTFKRAALILGGAAAFAWPLTLLLGIPNGAPQLICFSALSAALSGLIFFTVAQYDSQLTKRIADANAANWRVEVNGVTVGSITDQKYATILRQVMRDSDIAFAQVVHGHQELLFPLRQVHDRRSCGGLLGLCCAGNHLS